MTTPFGWGINGEPGSTALMQSAESNIFWGTQPVVTAQYTFADIVSTAVDSTNSPTTILRPGLVMGIVDATGLWTAYSPTATDGSQQAKGILLFECNMNDPVTLATANRLVSMVISGPVKASALFGLDLIARKQLRAAGFIFDDDRTSGYGVPFIRVVNKAASYTVLASDHGTLFTASAAATFTLPALAAGLHFMFYNLADATMVIASAGSSDNIVTDGDAAADTVTYSEAAHKIGAGLMVIANADATKWLTFNMSAGPGNLQTIA